MKTIQYMSILITTLLSSSCQSNTKKNVDAPVSQVSREAHQAYIPLSQEDLNSYETAYFASGCFWCVEAIFESVRGVKEVISGYAGGTHKAPTYQLISSGKTDHAEAVKVYYDPAIISFTELVQVFFGSHDPTQLNAQGPDRGRQYRSIAFYKTNEQKNIIKAYIKALNDSNVFDGDPVTTEVTEFTTFYDAEEYHQNFERNNPNNSYVRNVSIPRLNRFKKNFGAYLKENTQH